MKEENMTAQKLITVGENENTVFRSCKDGIHTNVFETICAFLNTRGGTLLLGVDESGEVYGFKERAIPDIIQALKMATQNADTFQPPFEMEPVREIVDGKYVLVLNVPESANVHALRGKVFVRRGIENIRVERKEELTRLYVQKQEIYTERKIYPFMRENDLSDSLIERAKALLLMKNEEHPFGRLENHVLLKEMNLSGINYETGERGLRLLAGLLFGKDMTLRNLFANTAVTCERQVDGETQRLNMETNLLDEAEKLIRFLQPAVGEETAKAFVSEFLLSREYTSAYPAKITASSQKLTAEFAVSMGRFGNPMLKKYFCEFGIASEEDSYGLTKEEHDGICRMTWQKEKSGKTRQELVKEAVVKTPLAAENRAFSKTDVNDPQEKESADGERFTPQERQMQILKMMAENERITISAMVQELQVTKRTILRDIDKMKKQGWLKREGSEKNGRWILLGEAKEQVKQD